MDTFEKWSLIFAGITASGVIIGLVASIIKIAFTHTRKIKCDFELTHISHGKDTIYITATLNLISQLSFSTSVMRMELIFGDENIPATHFQTVFSNMYTYTPTKNILISPLESVSVENARFDCPIAKFKTTALLKISTPKRNYFSTITFPPLKEEKE